MYVEKITPGDGFARKTTIEAGLSLEELAPVAEGLDLAVVNALVGRKYRITIVQRQMGQRSSEYYAATRVYVSTPDVLGEHPPYGQRGANADDDKAWDAYNRDEVRVMKALCRAYLPLLTALTVGRVDKIGFSRKAGCSCPCSPGLILRDAYLRFAGLPVDVWISEVKEG